MKLDKAFTLIELMIVIAIIGILSAFAIPQMRKYFDRANETKIYRAYMTLNKYAGVWAADKQGQTLEKFTNFNEWFDLENQSQVQELLGVKTKYLDSNYTKLEAISGRRKATIYITSGGILMSEIEDVK